jgi:hypothetical protein
MRVDVMKKLGMLLISLSVAGCNSTATTAPTTIPNDVSFITATPTPTVSATPTPTPSPSPSPSVPVVKVDPFSPFNLKYTYINQYDGSGKFLDSKRVDLNVGWISSYNHVVTTGVWFMYFGRVASDGTPILSACNAQYAELLDSDTNTHTLILKDLVEASHPIEMYAGLLFEFYPDPKYPDQQWFYDSSSPCQDLQGSWKITFTAGSYGSNEMNL